MGKKTDFLKPINNASVVQQVIDRLTEAMLSKELKPGDRIPTEIELSESFGVGRNSIREAIKILVSFGVLEIRRADGTFVRDGFSDSIIDPMLYGIILHTGDDSFESLKELRELMEIGVVKLAIQKCDETDRKELLEKYEAMEQAILTEPVDVSAVFEADNEFHKAVSVIGKNSLLDKINAIVRTLTHTIRLRTVTNMIEHGERDALLAVHKEICDVIIEKDVAHVDEVIRRSYFYEKGVLQEQEE